MTIHKLQDLCYAYRVADPVREMLFALQDRIDALEAQRKPLTVQEIAAFVGTHQYGPEQLKWFRLGEAAHGIKEGA